MSTPMRHWLSTPTGFFANHVLRGIGLVMLQNNPLTGLLFLLGIFVSDWVSGLYALLGTVIATWTAMLFGAPEHEINRGIYGFNGTLVGLALAFYLGHVVTLIAYVIVYVIVASMFVTIATAALKNIFGAQGHALTAPFVITTWIFTGALLDFTRLSGAWSLDLPQPQLPTVTVIARATDFSATDILVSILSGPAQVMLQHNVWTGAIFLLAIGINSRISCAAAVLGSALGAGIAWALGASPHDIRAGLYGFNAVLTAIALGGVFFLLHRLTVVLAILAVCVSTILFATFVIIFKPLGLPVLTMPFVITTWLCLLAGVSLPRLAALSPVKALTPERNLLAAQRAAAEKT